MTGLGKDRMDTWCDLSRSSRRQRWERVVRLQRPPPKALKTRAPPLFPTGRQAAARNGTGAVAAVDSNRTDTRFDTPDSSIVTP